MRQFLHRLYEFLRDNNETVGKFTFTILLIDYCIILTNYSTYLPNLKIPLIGIVVIEHLESGVLR